MQNIDSQRIHRLEQRLRSRLQLVASPPYLQKGYAFLSSRPSFHEAPPPPQSRESEAASQTQRTGRQLTQAVLTRSPSPAHPQTQDRIAIQLRHQDRSSSYCRTHAGILDIVSSVEVAT